MKSLKSLLMLCIAAMLCGACAENGGDEGNGALTLSANPSSIMANIETAQLVVKIGNKRLSADEITLYNEKGVVIEVPNLQFSSDTPGTYGFQAGYHHPTNGDMLSNFITVRVTKEVAMPEAPVDAEPSNLNFARRILLAQFTGSECPYCPYMSKLLRTALETYGNEVVLCAIHQHTSKDNAYLDNPILTSAMGVSGFPTIVADMHKNYKTSNYNSQTAVNNVISGAIKRVEARAAVAATSLYDSENGTIAVLAKVKANTTGEYRVGMWVLEDGIESPQNNALSSADNTHNNCVRYVDSKAGGRDYSGLSVGTINSGEYANTRFILDVENHWNMENCHVVVFVSSKESDGKFYVNNIIDVPLNGSVGFNYAK